MENKRNKHIGEDEVVCRLCIKIPLNGRYTALGETDGISLIRDMMKIHLPEMDLSISEKPIICEACHVQLKNYVSFATNCMAVEEKIKLYCDLQKVNRPVDLARVLQFMEDKTFDLQNRLNKDLVIKREVDSLKDKVENIQAAEGTILEDQLVDSSSASEFYLKNEEIDIKSENDDMSEEIDPVPTVSPNNSEKSSSLKRKKQIRKSPSKGGRHKDKSEVAMHKCDNCEFETRYKGNINRHMLTHGDKGQSGMQMHMCQKCEYMTSHKGHLNDHIMLKHSDRRAKRKFKCDKCTYEADMKHKVRQHNLIHMDISEVEMHKCENCEFVTKYKSCLYTHIMVKHRDPKAEKRFKCDKCPFETDFTSTLRRHSLIHDGKSKVEMYKCANCAYETKLRNSMINHTAKHRITKAEKKFKCDQCTFETHLKASLCRHSLIHKDKSEVEMFKCANCEYETKRKDTLIPHMLKHMFQERRENLNGNNVHMKRILSAS